MKLKIISLIGMLALTAAVMFAHGDKKHVMGTLEKINADSVVVKQADGKEVEVKLVANTMYVTRDGKGFMLSPRVFIAFDVFVQDPRLRVVVLGVQGRRGQKHLGGASALN